MTPTALPMISAVWLGILTSISPCPLATNIAATTFIGKQIKTRYGNIATAAAYTMGRAFAYMLVCLVIVHGLSSTPVVSMFLQRHMNKLLGPLMIVVGLIILNIIPLRLPVLGNADSVFIRRLGNGGFIGAILLGFIFALSFCPVSAALFFGSVLPLAVQYESGVWLPMGYGIGTALPVIVFAGLLAYSARFAANFVKGTTVFERYMRRCTAVLFIGIGTYFTITYLIGINLLAGIYPG